MEQLGLSMRFILAVLATWRVTHLLASEDGPADVIVKFRAMLGQSLAGTLMDCFKCLSLWIAALAALFVTRQLIDWLLVWLAVSGAVCLLQRLGREPVVMQPVSQPSEGDAYYVLRSKTSGIPEQFNESDDASRGPRSTWPSVSPPEPVPGCSAKHDAPHADDRAKPTGPPTAATHESPDTGRITLCSS